MIQIILSKGAYISKTNKSSFEAISCHQICFRNVEDAASVWKMKVHKSQAIFQNKLNFPLKCEKQWNYSNGRTTVGTQFLFWVKCWLGLHILLSLILTYCVNKPCFVHYANQAVALSPSYSEENANDFRTDHFQVCLALQSESMHLNIWPAIFYL